MSEYKVHIINTGKVRIEPELAFGGDHCSTAKAAGFSIKRSPKIWLPVNVFLVETPDKLVLLDTGWDHSMSPNGVFDKKAQKKSLEWIRKESLDPNCVRSLACHGIEEKPEVFEF